jgi:hypothetical protein
MTRFNFGWQENDVFELIIYFSVQSGGNFTVNIGVLVGFEVIAAVTVKSTIIWLMTPSVYRTTLRYNREYPALLLSI